MTPEFSEYIQVPEVNIGSIHATDSLGTVAIQQTEPITPRPLDKWDYIGAGMCMSILFGLGLAAKGFHKASRRSGIPDSALNAQPKQPKKEAPKPVHIDPWEQTPVSLTQEDAAKVTRHVFLSNFRTSRAAQLQVDEIVEKSREKQQPKPQTTPVATNTSKPFPAGYRDSHTPQQEIGTGPVDTAKTAAKRYNEEVKFGGKISQQVAEILNRPRNQK
jgi:hypothetical protein